ncbi:MAG: ribonuclease J [Hyphomicrobiales bacterium]
MARQRTSRKSRSSSSEMVLVPLGGCGEIGMNLYLYGFGPPKERQWLMVDAGVKFGDERDPGIDIILPDTAFIEAERHALQGILLTHAHEDHFGAVAHLWPRLKVPVYATPFTAYLLRRKLAEAGLEDQVPIHEIAMGDRLTIGPFDLELITVTHSIPEPNAVAIRTPAGTVLHSGDWKVDPTPVIGDVMAEDRLRALGEEGCDVLVCDSTNALRDGISPSESDVAQGLLDVIRTAKARVAVTTFASNAGRIASIVKAAQACDRQVVLVGRAMRRIVEAAKATGYMQDLPELLDEDEYGFLPRDKVLCLCTGSQGERRAALWRIAEGSHPNVTFDSGDLVVFSSRTIPGNEKSVGYVQNELSDIGVSIVTADDAPVHVTGHPRRGELQQMYDWVKPALVVPMHGEARHLWEHARFARSCGVPAALVVENGDVARLLPAPGAVIDEAPSGRLHVDGRLIVPSFDGPARIRRKMSFTGVVAVSLVLDRDGELQSDPGVETLGLPEHDADGVALEDTVYDIVEDVFETLPRAKLRSDEIVEEFVRRAVRRALDMRWGKKPQCLVTIHRI